MIGRAREVVFGALAVAAVPATAGASTIFDDNHCKDRLVLCLDYEAKFFEAEHTQDLRVGERVHVIVIGDSIDGMTVSIDVGSVSSANSTLPKKDFDGQRAAARVAAMAAVLPPPQQKLAEKIVEIPDADELIIYVVQEKAGEVDISSRSLQIRDTLYFARAGLAFTWTDRGSRTITAESSVVEKTDFYPGVALTIWPWGHRGRTLSALEKRTFWGSLGDAFALQIGTDLDFTKPFDRATFGLAFEPISGIGISAGIAISKGQFFSGAPPGSAMTIADQRMVRPYFSLALTTELFDTIKSLAGTR